MKKAVFLDRDGVINRKAAEGEYVTRWEEMEFLPGVGEAIRLLRDAGFFVIVVTNQRCVAKGLITSTELEAMHARMRCEFEAKGATIDAVYYCPHENEPACACRKPQPGMLLQAAREHDVDLAASWMIGDSSHDVEAGRRAGCRTFLIVDQADQGESGDSSPDRADLMASSLLDGAHKILQLEAAMPRSSRSFSVKRN
jgi:D-glycero-D-manno-heptose 1,7-bisphosphate phosphatase